MNKKDLKHFFILLISMVVSEILNGIVYLSSYSLIGYFITKDFISYVTEEKIDIICRIIVAIFAVISYFFISKKVLCKFGNEKYKHIALVLLSIIILLSYPLSAHFSILSGWFYSIHWSMCSPIAYVLVLPFLLLEKTIPILYEILFVLLSPISVLLIWLFSKIGNRKKKSEDSSVIA